MRFKRSDIGREAFESREYSRIRAENRDQLPPCCCVRNGEEWLDAGCRRHRPIRSYVGYKKWGKHAEA